VREALEICNIIGYRNPISLANTLFLLMYSLELWRMAEQLDTKATVGYYRSRDLHANDGLSVSVISVNKAHL